MQKRANVQQETGDAERNSSLGIFIIVTVALIALAAISLALIPRGTKLQQCNGILLQGEKENCIYTLALSEQNSTICSYLSTTDADNCYSKIADNTSDPSLCDKVSDPNQKATCIGALVNATGNYSMCGYLQSSFKDSCLINQATKQEEIGICSNVSQGNNQTTCDAAVYLKLAIAKSNATYCGSVTNSLNINITTEAILDSGVDIYPKISSNTTNLLEYAAFVQNASFSARDFCYDSFAAQATNSSECANVKNAFLSQSCYDQVLTHQESRTAANFTMNSTAYADFFSACYNETGDAASCNSTIGIIRAASTDNVSECATLNQSSSTACYVYIAEATHNGAICSHIKNLTLNTACLQDSTLNATTGIPAAVNGS